MTTTYFLTAQIYYNDVFFEFDYYVRYTYRLIVVLTLYTVYLYMIMYSYRPRSVAIAPNDYFVENYFNFYVMAVGSCGRRL